MVRFASPTTGLPRRPALPSEGDPVNSPSAGRAGRRAPRRRRRKRHPPYRPAVNGPLRRGKERKTGRADPAFPERVMTGPYTGHHSLWADSIEGAPNPFAGVAGQESAQRIYSPRPEGGASRVASPTTGLPRRPFSLPSEGDPFNSPSAVRAGRRAPRRRRRKRRPPYRPAGNGPRGGEGKRKTGRAAPAFP